MNKIAQKFCKEAETINFIGQKSARKHIAESDKHLNNFGIIRSPKKIINFLSNS